MGKEEFFDKAMDEISEQLPEELKEGTTLALNKVVKCNDIELHGVSLKRDGTDISPNIYLDSFYERHENGEDLGVLMNEVVDMFKDTELPELGPNDISLDYESIKDNLTFRLLELRRNRMFLVNVPYMSVGNGLALVCDIKVRSNEDGEWRTTITKDMMEKNGYDKKELFAHALENIRDVDPPVMVDVESSMFGNGDNTNLLEKDGKVEHKSNMYVLTNRSGVLGASALFYPEVQEQISEKLGEGYSVIPSSIHEVIIVPDSAGFTGVALKDMVKDANSSVVASKDILSDNVFHFDKDEKALSVSDTGMSMKSRVSEARC